MEPEDIKLPSPEELLLRIHEFLSSGAAIYPGTYLWDVDIPADSLIAQVLRLRP